MHRQKRIFIVATVFIFTCLTSISLKSQTRISSPYSRYGIGSLNQITNARTLGMGGVDQALASPLYINYNNPASYASFKQQSFVFNGGLRTQQTELITNSLSQTSNYTSLGYLQFGTPITNWMGLSFGLLPYSNVGYNIIDDVTITDIGHVVYNYEGTGGINQVYLGTGFNITPKLSIGINGTYYFGRMDFIRSSTFPDSINIQDIRITDRQSPSDFRATIGIRYQTDLSEDYALSLGATFSHKTRLNVNRDYLVESVKTTPSGITTVFDTIVEDNDLDGNIILPNSFGGGFVLHKKGSWQLAGDFKYDQWQDYEAFGIKDSLQNSFTAALGYEFSPQSTSVSSYFRKMYYRLGIRYHKSYLQLRETQLNQYGISFGFGFPVPKSASTIDLGVELGQMGTTDNNLIKENYVKVSIGLSIFDRWYIKRKYD